MSSSAGHQMAILLVIGLLTFWLTTPILGFPAVGEVEVPEVPLSWQERGHTLVAGDIIMPPTNLFEELGQGTKDTRKRWLNRRMPYYIDPDHPTKDKIEAGIAHWNENLGGCLELSPWQSGDEDYVYVQNGEGCNSYLGRYGGSQPMNLNADGCSGQGTVVHEFMHAAGVIHEHQRPDRGITVQYENIVDEWKQWWKPEDEKVNSYGPYDCYSIMHYPRIHPSYSIDNKPAFTLNKKGCNYNRIGNGNDFTQGDLRVIRRMYNCN